MSALVDHIDHAAQSFTGRLIRPFDEGYDDLRRVHNGLIDKHPALIARCAGVADVVDAITMARTMNLEVAVRGGGHNVAGHATVDHGLMIDLSSMKGIHVDVHARTARAEGGVLLLDSDESRASAKERLPVAVERERCEKVCQRIAR